MHCICMIRILYNGMLLCISSHLYVQQHHVGKLKSAMVEVFTQGTIANTIYKSASFFFFREPVVKYLPAYHRMGAI